MAGQIRAFGLSLARRPMLGPLLGRTFASNLPLWPLKVVLKNPKVVAFAHPVPSRTGHLLIVPRLVCKTLFDLLRPEHDDIVAAVIDAALTLSNDKPQPQSLCINWGCRQDVMQAHFHLWPCVQNEPPLRGGSPLGTNDAAIDITERQFHRAIALARASTGSGGTLYLQQVGSVSRCFAQYA